MGSERARARGLYRLMLPWLLSVERAAVGVVCRATANQSRPRPGRSGPLRVCDWGKKEQCWPLVNTWDGRDPGDTEPQVVVRQETKTGAVW